jgi:nicotinamide phosphoribosyltransferase
VNKKGYKVLNAVRLIQGDGVDANLIHMILSDMAFLGWSVDNIAFGMGGALLQKCSRDTLGYAMKANATFRDNKWHDVYKRPITDPGKHSLRGIIKDERFEVVFDGDLKKDYDWLQVRQRASLNAVVQTQG